MLTVVPNFLQQVPLLTAEQARAKAKEYRDSRSIYTDLAWQINHQALTGGHIVSFQCLREADGLSEAIEKLNAGGFTVTSTRESNYNDLVCVRVMW